MTSRLIRRLLAGVLPFVCLVAGPPRPAAKDLPELRARIEAILKDTKAPGLGVALADRQGTRWAAGFGHADVAGRRTADERTLFHLGSVSKLAVGLTALKLQEEGRLDLQTPVRTILPDLPFVNPWETTHPLRLAHLLEHTSGWDDVRLCQTLPLRGAPLSLRDGLVACRASMVCRWRPGTRHAYSNVGVDAAAYALERAAGQDFEALAAQIIFKPLGMDSATYRLSPDPRLARLYAKDGTTALPWDPMLLRPSGALKVSAGEMLRLLQLFAGRGHVEGQRLLAEPTLLRMEHPQTLLGVAEGLQAAPGITNQSQQRGGFHWRGHSGNVSGALSNFRYLPEAGVGYWFALNSESDAAYSRINQELRSFVIKGLPKPTPKPLVTLATAEVIPWLGWYQLDSPRNEQFRIIDHLLGLGRLCRQGQGLALRPALGESTPFLPVGSRLFRELEDPEPILALVQTPEEGRFIQVKDQTLRKIPAPLAWLQISLLLTTTLLIIGTFCHGVAWGVLALIRRGNRPAHLALRLWPLAASASFIAALALPFSLGESTPRLLGNLTWASVGLAALTTMFALSAVSGLTIALRTSGRSLPRFHGLACGICFTLASLYMAWQGVLPLATWR